MKAKVIFPNVRWYEAQRFEVKLGEVFQIELTEHQGKVLWFADEDQVLSIDNDEEGATATIKATALGSSQIQLQGPNRQVHMVLDITVYGEEAVRLGATVGGEVPK